MAAAQLQHDHRNWLVLWGCYTHVYIAFPLFRAPRGTVLTAAVPADLVVKMRRQERFAGVHAPPPEDAAAPGGGAPAVSAPHWPPAVAPPAGENRDQPAAQGWYAAPDAGDPPSPPPGPPAPGPPGWPGR